MILQLTWLHHFYPKVKQAKMELRHISTTKWFENEVATSFSSFTDHWWKFIYRVESRPVRKKVKGKKLLSPPCPSFPFFRMMLSRYNKQFMRTWWTGWNQRQLPGDKEQWTSNWSFGSPSPLIWRKWIQSTKSWRSFYPKQRRPKELSLHASWWQLISLEYSFFILSKKHKGKNILRFEVAIVVGFHWCHVEKANGERERELILLLLF